MKWTFYDRRARGAGPLQKTLRRSRPGWRIRRVDCALSRWCVEVGYGLFSLSWDGA